MSETFAKNRLVAPLSPLSAGRAGSVAEAVAAESLTPGTRVSWDGSRAGDEQPAKASRSGSATTGLQPFNTRSLCGSHALTQVRFAILGDTKAARWAKRACSMKFASPYCARNFAALKIIVAITGASGAIYTQRLLDNLHPAQHELHVVLSNYAHAVIAEELADGLRLPPGTKTHSLKSMNAPFASGSNAFDAMVVIPCSMGTLGRIAHGTSEDVLLRAADVMLKERRKLILVPRETPLNLVHVKNFELLLQAGATILPANPCFYTNPKTIEQVVDTVVARVLDHLGVPQKLMPRWAEEKE